VTSAIDAVAAMNGNASGTLRGIGICSPGPLDPKTGVVINPPNLPCWRNFPLAAEIQRRYGVSARVDNDGNAAALWGHYAIFGPNSKETSISTIVGTGNGGGVILEGNVVKGKNGFGGELGHVLLPYQSIAGIAGMVPKCNCGRIGDLESLCSLTGIQTIFTLNNLDANGGGPFPPADPNLETAARQQASEQILSAACEASIMKESADDAKQAVEQLLTVFGFQQVTVTSAQGAQYIAPSS
jgi:predicted NBD/HSP70 family sugar kinase